MNTRSASLFVIVTMLLLGVAYASIGEGTVDSSSRPSHASSGEQINWSNVNSGGQDTQSPAHTLKFSVGQSVIGYTVSASHETGIGYWFGAGVCHCPYQSDCDEDGFITALDLSCMIDILFAGQPDVKDPDCPSPRADFDCDGFSTALDLSGLIDHLFAGGDGPCDPCNP